MTNSTRHKKQKTKDFQKVKLKVGQKKQAAANHTDTSFRSQAIVLTGQNLHADRANQQTNARNLTLTDLVPQLKHYNGVVKRDALHGLNDLVKQHPAVIGEQLGVLVNSLVRLFVDDEPVIRKLVRGFCVDHFRALPESKLAAFYPIILAYTNSAMTHIDEEIRIDGLKLLNTWIEILPRYMGQYKQKIIPEN
ncbi:hypothetical protein BJ085DRAFT_29091 [Dimargaris cristalligena]|uniref:Pre-rRNA-processing protein n=1 Tax=Dimargaris cristalligena TaxID=215637 RepID=A0A4P9ZST7_9FUNG|nr:hypothetical protein BJ085DRAFT_29091 [Dimargaris cristalligena]|eukprot:RKP36553.1 hypothetical protein BJ085DRAFT_29091 [Dimargaris cristalligena]